MRIIFALTAAAAVPLAAAPQWTLQSSGTAARLRGVSAVSADVAWASGSGGAVLRTTDAGETWQRLAVPDAERLDFRDIDAVNARTAWVLSIGNGAASRIYRTTDAGATWTFQFTNDDERAFFDAMAFWDAQRGVAVSDAVDGRLVILLTADGGRTWSRVPGAALPEALPGEGCFAASGTNVAVHAGGLLWIGTGAAERARVYRSTDWGRTWAVADTPLASGPTEGIYSVAFRDERHGVVVGGDYRQESAAVDNAAITTDGGATWTLVGERGLSGFRSRVAWVPGAPAPTALAIGPSGADVSTDGGVTWTALEGPGFDAFSFTPDGRRGWGTGSRGRIGRLDGLVAAAAASARGYPDWPANSGSVSLRKRTHRP